MVDRGFVEIAGLHFSGKYGKIRASSSGRLGLIDQFINRVFAMVSIRLSRGGAKRRPFYHIVVTDSRNRRDGRYIERLGYFNPIATGGERKLKVDLERADYWLSHGAQLSDRVAQLVKQARGTEAS